MLSHFYYYYHQLSLISLLFFTSLYFIDRKKNKKLFKRELIAKLNWEIEEQKKRITRIIRPLTTRNHAKKRNSNRRGTTTHIHIQQKTAESK